MKRLRLVTLKVKKLIDTKELGEYRSFLLDFVSTALL
jgi:hypothetical protein